jgi:pyruvate dehydrogenase E2 component (dihydrolipoamide acetyltransferase)
MPINILMPALSPTMEKGNLAKWLKKEGETVKPGDVIAEIETDKATMEVEAVDEGVLAKIVVPEGTADVPVNQLIAVLAGEGEDASKVTAGAAPAKAAEAPKTPALTSPQGEEVAAQGAAGEGVQQSKAPATGAPSPQPSPPEGRLRPSSTGYGGEGADRPSGATAQTNGHGRTFSSPLARRLAKEAGIDIARIAGSGPHGRVVARDVAGAKDGKGLKAPGAAPSAGTAAPAIAPTMSDEKVRALFEDGSYEVVPHDNMRRVIAQRLTASTQTIPHFYLTIDCVIDRLMAAREEINASAPKNKEGKPAYKLSVNDFVVKALAVALQRIPDANVSWTESGMLKHKHSDVGVAVALPGGLITPIVRHAEAKSLSVISNELKDMVARARARKLKPHEYQGGTTAVSNLGMYGIKDFTAVINPPHATILAAGAGEERAIVRKGQVVAATVMSVTLSCDHRAVDGALGAELIGAFKALIENPVMMVV